MNFVEQLFSTPASVGWMGLCVVAAVVAAHALRGRRKKVTAGALAVAAGRARPARRDDPASREKRRVTPRSEPGCLLDRQEVAEMTRHLPAQPRREVAVHEDGAPMWRHDAPTTVLHLSSEMRERARRERMEGAE